MTTGLNTADLIPGNDVTDAFADLQMTVWAHPGFTVVGVRPDARLSGVVDAAFCFAPTDSKAHCVQI